MSKNYIFLAACFDRELLRKQLIILNENSIDYKLIDKSELTHFRAPLSTYFEAEIHVAENELEKADNLLAALNE